MSKTEVFWQRLDALLERSQIVIDRPKGSRHPRFQEIYMRWIMAIWMELRRLMARGLMYGWAVSPSEVSTL